MSAIPYQALADIDRSQLIVVDIQTRLTNVMHDPKPLLHQCNILIQSAKLLDIPVTVTEQYPKGIGSTESSLVESLGVAYQPVEKTCFSCLGKDQFKSRLEQYPERNQFILCGIEAHVCVLQTAIDLLKLNPAANNEVYVVADAVDSRNKKNKKIALKRLDKAGAIITCTESVVLEWLKDSTHEHFKQISALIK